MHWSKRFNRTILAGAALFSVSFAGPPDALGFVINSRRDTELRATPTALSLLDKASQTIVVGDAKGLQIMRPRGHGFYPIGGHFTKSPVRAVAATLIDARTHLAYALRGESAVHIAPVTTRGTIGIGPVVQIPGRPRALVADEDGSFIVTHSAGVDRLIPASAGAFRRHSLSDVPNTADAAVIDLDGDAYLDLALADEPLGEIVILRGQPDGSMEQISTIRTQRGARRIRAADVDGDGQEEIVILGYSGLSLHLRNASGKIGEETPLLEESHLTDLAIGDLDGDGTDDLIYTNRSRTIVASLLGSAKRKLTPGPTFLTGGGPGHLLVEPLNNTDREDIVVANTIGRSLTRIAHDQRGLAGVAAVAATIGKISAAATADYDGDGNLDIALVGDESGRLEVHLGHGNGHFTILPSIPVARRPRSIVAGDWDGDNKVDLAVADFSSDRIAILQGNGRGGFAIPSHVPCGSGPSALLFGDFGGPNGLDLAVANRVADSISILHGDGKGRFTSGPSFSVGPRPSFLLSGDVDGDGDPDLITGNQQREAISILRRSPDGFSQATTKVLGDFPKPSAALDLDGDRIAELVVTDRATGSVTVMRGTNGNFKEIKKIQVGRDPTSVTLGDFDADGIEDLAIIHRSTGVVTILFISRDKIPG